MLARRSLLTVVALVTAGASRDRARKGAGHLRLGYLLPVESQLGAGALALSQTIAAATKGRLRIEHFPDSALGGEVEMLAAVQRGTLDLAFITGAPLPNILPEAGVFGIPFLFASRAQAQAALDGPIGEEFLARFSGKGLIALAWGENGMRHITNAKRPIRGPADLAGLRLRLPQSPVMLTGFRALGADASPLPFPQLYSALESGVFDGQENPVATIIAAKFDRVQKYLSLTGHIYDPAVIVVAPDTWAELAPADRALLRMAARRAAAVSRSVAGQMEISGVPRLRSAGMEIITGIDRAPFAAAMRPAAEAYEKEFGRDVIARLRATA